MNQLLHINLYTNYLEENKEVGVGELLGYYECRKLFYTLKFYNIFFERLR